MKQHFPQKFASLKRLFVVLAILVAGTNSVLAQYTETDLVSDGWTKVTTLEALQTAANNGNMFVLLDTRDSQMAMTRTNEPRPVYQPLTSPANNVWQVWLLTIKDNYYQFRNLSRNKEYLYTVTGETWNCFYNTDNSTNNSKFSFALSNGKWMITNLYSNQYLGHWGDNENAATTGEGIASNKPLDKNFAAGFYVYTIGVNQYFADYGQSQQEITSYFIKNPSFETGNTDGWTVATENNDGDQVGAYNDKGMTNMDGTYLFNGYGWWTISISISQAVADLPAGEYEVSAVLAAWDGQEVIFATNSVRTAQTGTGADNGILTTNSVSIGDEGNLAIEVRRDINWWDYPEGETAPDNVKQNFFKADYFRLKCNGLYLSVLATQLPNDNTTELVPGTWYVYDVASDGNYSLQGDLGSMVYTTNGHQLFTSATGQTVDEAIQLSAGKVFFKTSKTGVTLRLTKMSSVNEGEVTFTACALNVDGMPNKILGITLNGDGPGESGSVLIGQYLKASGIDIIGVSEDFNYNNTIYNEMSSDYNQGHYRGGLSLAGGNAAGLSGTRFDTDGLNIFVKNTYTFGPTAESYDSNWQLWSHQAGSIGEGDGGQFDELVKKGFRYYEVTLKSGFTIDVFVLHMDAGSRNGESGTAVDGLDALARNDQLLQLKTYILDNKDNGRPKIVIGDTNCRYTRDKVKENFIDQINNDGRYVAKDAWVELVRNNDYPVYNTASLTSGSPNSANREIVDKIFYLNPTSGTHRLKAMAFNIDESYTLGDHEPVVVTFKTVGASNASADQSTWWKGENPLNQTGAHLYYIYNVGRKVFATDASNPTVTDIHRAVRWGLYDEGGNDRTISRGTGWRFKDGSLGTSSACTFSVITSSNTSGAYNLQWKTGIDNHHWFGINDDGNYNTGNTSNSVNKDWFFISQEQKDAYDEYVAAYNNAQLLTSLPNFSQQTALKALLAAADGEHANYDNCKGTNGYTAQLKSIYNQALAEYKAYIANDETANIVNPSFEDADISAWTYNTSAGDVGRKDLGNNTYKFTATDGANIGSWTFNTWDGGSTQHHYVRQSTAASLPAGYYIMKAYVATDKEYITTSSNEEVLHNRQLMYLMVNDKEFSIVVNNAKEQGVPYEVLVYHNGGTMTVGAHSDNSFNYWFKVDAFSLSRYISYYDVNVTAAQWATVSLPKNTTIPSGVQIYYATEFKDGDSESLYKLHLEEYSGTTLPNGTNLNANSKPSGFLVYAETPQVYRFYVTNNTATAPSGNLLNGTPDARIEASARDTNKDQYVLAKKNDVVGMYKLADNQGIKRFYAYVEYDKDSSTPTKDGFLLSTNDDTNGIESVNREGNRQEATGIATIHSLNGARLNNLRRGVNIVRMSDGTVKKVIIR